MLLRNPRQEWELPGGKVEPDESPEHCLAREIEEELSLLEGDVVPDAASLRPVDGYLPVPRTSPTPDPDLLETYELSDTAQVAWWRQRLDRVRAELDRSDNADPSG